MKIYITCTEEFSSEKLNSVFKLLNKISGEIKFPQTKTLSNKFITYCNGKFNDLDNLSSLTFNELFEICEYYRYSEDEKILTDDFVVLITSIENEKHWFSAVNGKNIFIHSTSFSDNTDRDEVNGIAYNILVNIFQSLLGINYETLSDSSIVHHSSIGCINDYCKKKADVILKLRTGYICDNCLNEAIRAGASAEILLNIYQILQHIREKFMNLEKIKDKLIPKNIFIDKNGNIFIGDTNLKLEPLQKTLMYFYLSKEEGFITKMLNDSKVANEINVMYRAFNGKRGKTTIINLCKSPSTSDSTYSTTKNALHTKIKRTLGDDLSAFYEIIDEESSETKVCKIKKDNYNVKKDADFTKRLDKINNIKTRELITDKDMD